MTCATRTSWEKELRKNICTNFGLGIRVSSWGSYDTSTIKKDITAVMGVTFAVK